MTDVGATRPVRVAVLLPESMDLPSGSVLRARVEVSSVADRAPEVVARTERPLTELRPGDEVTVTLDVPAGLVDDSASYTVFCHLDTTGSGDVTRGDALTTQVVPVLTHGSPDDVAVQLHPI